MQIDKKDVAALLKSAGATSVPDPEVESKKQKNELKKLLESYMQVAEHMFGRPPTIDEMIGMLTEAGKKPEDGQEQSDQAQTAEPLQKEPTTQSTVFKHDQTSMAKAASNMMPQKLNIMSTNVYFGRDKNKQPDPKHVLFYEHPDGAVYNASNSQWEDSRPHVLDHLDNRPLMYNELDLNNYILHGLMQPEEYESLGHMLPENCHKMWALKKKIEDAQSLLSDEAINHSDTHGKVMEMEYDLRELLQAVEHLQTERESMLTVLSEHGLDGQFMPSEDVNISPELQMEHEIGRRKIAADDLIEGDKKDSDGDAGGIESISPTDAAQLPGISSTIGKEELT